MRPPTEGPATPHPAAQVLAALLALLALALYLDTGFQLADRPVSFDGAMNLQVAERLAAGDGYVRHYAGERAFPQEIQSNAPFILPAALVFELFGVGLLTAQLTNLVYLLGLCVVAALALPGANWVAPWRWLAALAVLATPGLLDAGANGYGEFPGLCWWLAGTALLFLPPPVRVWRIAGGLCLSLALLTKTVMILPVAVTLAVWFASTVLPERRITRATVMRTLGLGAALLVPVLLFELWRLAGLGGPAGYLEWWSVQLDQIGMQAGVEPGYADTPGWLGKLAVHFRLFAGFLGLDVPLAVVWLLLPLALAFASARSDLQGRNGFVIVLALTVLAYSAWWLLLTPTEKAWHRRIINAMVLVNLLWVHGACWLAGRSRTRVTGGLLAALLGAWFVLQGLAARQEADPAARSFMAGVERVRALPSDALLLGQGWSSAPQVALYSGRRLRDLNTIPYADLDGRAHIYVVRDVPARAAGAFADLLALYPHEVVFESEGLEVLAIDTTRRGTWLEAPDAAAGAGMDTFRTREGPRPPSRGLFGDRWAMTRLELVLEARERPASVRLALYTPGHTPYRHGNVLELHLAANGCALGRRVVETDGARRLDWEVPGRCGIAAGDPVHLVVESNNMLAGPFPADSRQLSYVLESVELDYGENGKNAPAQAP